MNWKEQLKRWCVKERHGVWVFDETPLEEIEELITKEIIEKVIDDIPYPKLGGMIIPHEILELEQQLRDKWL
jgi:hypothetical protein